VVEARQPARSLYSRQGRSGPRTTVTALVPANFKGQNRTWGCPLGAVQPKSQWDGSIKPKSSELFVSPRTSCSWHHPTNCSRHRWRVINQAATSIRCWRSKWTLYRTSKGFTIVSPYRAGENGKQVMALVETRPVR